MQRHPHGRCVNPDRKSISTFFECNKINLSSESCFNLFSCCCEWLFITSLLSIIQKARSEPADEECQSCMIQLRSLTAQVSSTHTHMHTFICTHTHTHTHSCRHRPCSLALRSKTTTTAFPSFLRPQMYDANGPTRLKTQTKLLLLKSELQSSTAFLIAPNYFAVVP